MPEHKLTSDCFLGNPIANPVIVKLSQPIASRSRPEYQITFDSPQQSSIALDSLRLQGFDKKRLLGSVNSDLRVWV